MIITMRITHLSLLLWATRPKAFMLLVTLTMLFSAIPLSSFQNAKQEVEYLPIAVSKNMTIEDALRAYMLEDYACNYQEFLKINQLSKPILLRQANNYKMPVKIYRYNGQNIRSSINIGNLQVAQAIQSYNTDLFKNNIIRASYKEGGYIYVPHHLINCRNEKAVPIVTREPQNNEGSEKIKVGVKTVKYEIFGKKYQDVPILSKKLKNKIFYVEGGHGGPDPGAQAKVNNRTLCEDEYAYDIALRITRKLIENGATVYLINRDLNDGIRDGEFLIGDRDEVTYPNLKVPLNHKARLTQRSDAVNELFEKFAAKGITDQRLIVVHIDSRGKKEQIDTFLYYQNGNEQSKKLAKKMLETLQDKYRGRRDWNGSLTTRDLHMLRETKPTTVFVEIGNIRNDFDRKRIMEKNNRQAIATWLAEGFMK